MSDSVPVILYKYKAFSMNSLDSLINDTVYLADPVSFNDPFDCQPSVVDDTDDIDVLREITTNLMLDTQVRKFIDQRKPVIEYINYQNAKLLEDIFESVNPLSLNDGDFLKKSNKYKNKMKGDFNGFSNSQTDILTNQIHDFLVNMEKLFIKNEPNQRKLIETYEELIKKELIASRNKGVLSLAKNNNCPLMWAHYADDHQGFCCGYRLPNEQKICASENKIKAVDYEGKRLILTSQLHELVQDLGDIRNTINNIIFYVKAENWLYEREYRMIGKLGLQKSPFILESVYFGLRCKDSVKFSIMSALDKRESIVQFYQMTEVKGTFDLEPKPISLADIQSLPVTYVTNQLL